MKKTRPFSELKTIMDDLFDPKLNMQFCCNPHPSRSGHDSRLIPRFYLKFGREIIWDFPKHFPLTEGYFLQWREDIIIAELLEEYIDTPVERLLKKKFKFDKFGMACQYVDANYLDTLSVMYRITELFRAADRRLGKEELLHWAKKAENPVVDILLDKRFNTLDMIVMSFRERAIKAMELLSRQGPVTFEQAKAQMIWIRSISKTKETKRK